MTLKQARLTKNRATIDKRFDMNDNKTKVLFVYPSKFQSIIVHKWKDGFSSSMRNKE